MSNRILIDATYMQQELRAVVVNDGVVNHLEIEAVARQQTKSYIYKGKVTRVEPSLEACFVDYGVERHGFLPLKDIAPQYYQNHHNQNNPQKQDNPDEKLSIKDIIKEGQELIVQVEKIERGNKGAALTTYITLAGSYLVLMPNSPKAGGVSKRIEGEERNALLEILKQLTIPEHMSTIIRTASVGKSLEELQWDLDVLLNLWHSIETTAAKHNRPLLIHQESNAMIRVLRDYLRQDTDEIIINDPAVYEEAKKYVECIRPNFIDKVKFHDAKTPLFTYYQIEKQVSTIFNRQVELPSGGSIVIDVTEALVAVDINSARATKGNDIEETALITNLEAATEIARQLRLRDLGGLVVIDFIDMAQQKNQNEVEERLRIALQQDRAKVQTSKISRFGLLELSRQRLRATLSETTKITCPHCQGHGMIRSIPSLSLAILRAIEDAAREESLSQIRAHLPIEIATFILNDQRNAIEKIEQKFDITILLIPNIHLTVPDYQIERIRNYESANSANNKTSQTSSYQLAAELKNTTNKSMSDYGLEQKQAQQQPALGQMTLPTHSNQAKATTLAKTNSDSIIIKFFKALFLGSTNANTTKTNNNRKKRHHSSRKNNHQNRNRSGQRQRQNNSGNRNNTGRQRHNNSNGNNNKGANNHRRRNSKNQHQNGNNRNRAS